MTGFIKDFDGEALTVIVPFSDGNLLSRQGITECEVQLCDGRQLSPIQRNKIFALVADIADFAAGIRYDSKARKSWRDEMLRSLQLDYILDICDREEVRRKLTENYCQLMNIDLFSLANRSHDTIDMTTARDFIDWLVELCVMHGIPCQDTLLNRCEDQARYLYACVMNRRCCICGKKADIHDVADVSGVLPVAKGGTGQVTLAAARNAMGLGNTTGALPVANGGTGATSLASITVGNATKWNNYTIWQGTQAAYDAITSKSSTTIYFIVG